MAEYEVLRGCYLPHRGGLRYFREGVIVDLDNDDLDGIDVKGYIQPFRPRANSSKSARPVKAAYGGKVDVSRGEVDFGKSVSVSPLPPMKAEEVSDAD